MEVNILVLIWIAGSVVGLWYSVRGAREALADLESVPPVEEAARALAASALKTQVIRSIIQVTWLIIGVIAVLSIAGILIVWGLLLTNFALAYLSRESYLTKQRTLAALLEKEERDEEELT